VVGPVAHPVHELDERLGEHRRSQHRVGGDVERAAHVLADRSAVRVGEVVRVETLHSQAVAVRHEGDAVRPNELLRDERPAEEPANPGGRLALEDEPRAQPHDPDLGVLALDAVEDLLDGRLVPAVEARAHSLRLPALAHARTVAGGAAATRARTSTRRCGTAA
jgi:hypothetical protein